jgi:hypothetical protein
MNQAIIIGFVNNHHSMYKLLIDYFVELYGQVSFLTNHHNHDIISGQIDDIRVNLYKCDDKDESVSIKKNKELIDSHLTLIIDEYYNDYRHLYRVKYKCKKIIAIVHNPNKFYGEWNNRNVKNAIKGYFIRNYISQVSAFITLGPNIMAYFASLYNAKPIFYFPFEHGEVNDTEITSEAINIIIPGMVTSSRRNYTLLLDVLEKYYHQNPQSKIRVKFLGKIREEDSLNINSICNRINENYGNKITIWKDFVPTETYEWELLNAQWIMSNIKVFNHLNNGYEIYGTTKGSGISYSIYKYSKPAIVPSLQHILTGFDSQLVRYDSYEDLIQIFTDIESGKISHDELNQRARGNTLSFNQKIQEEQKRLMRYLEIG